MHFQMYDYHSSNRLTEQICLYIPVSVMQGSDARSSVAVWHFVVVAYSQRLPSCHGIVSDDFHSDPNIRCDADIQRLR